VTLSRPRSIAPGCTHPFKRPRLSFLLFFSIALLLFSGTTAHAQVTLGWTASTSSNVTGYNVNYGTTTTNLGNTVNAENTTSYTFSGLTAGATYYFAVTAYNNSGSVSPDSNVVSYAVPVPCTYSISPASATIAASGATGSITVTTQSGCAWTASSAASWMSITSGASGTGSGTVDYSVAADTATSSRTAASTVAGLAFTVTQAAADPPAQPKTYAITASAGSGGSISPSGSVTVTSGASQSFSIKANSGYTISSVTVDGKSVGKASSYTFSGVTANHTISATFKSQSRRAEKTK